MGEAMETIARIPNLAPVPAESAAASREQAASPRAAIATGAGRRRPPFPTWSVATLAVIAAIAWTVATWHEQARLARQRRPDRLAVQPPATARESIAP